MSGGAFDYDQHRIRTIWETIQSIIKNNKKKDNFGYASNYSKKTLAEFERAISILKIAEVYAQRIDWLISGDDGEETFAERLAEDLAGIKAIPIEPPVKPAKNVKDFDWLNNKLNDILAEFEHKHITKEGAKDLLYEFIFEELVSEIQRLKDSSLSV